MKVSKDAKGIVSREKVTKKWTDWIDYWSVDFDSFEHDKPKTFKELIDGFKEFKP